MKNAEVDLTLIKLKQDKEFREVLDDKLPLRCRATKWACIVLLVLACGLIGVFLWSVDELQRIVSDVLFIATFLGAIRMGFESISQSDEGYIRRRMMLDEIRRTSTG